MSGARTVRLLVIGLGNLGRRLAGLVARKRNELLKRYGLDFRIVGAADSRGAAVDPEGLDGVQVEAVKEAGRSVAEIPSVGRLGMSGLALIETVDADALCEASPVHLEADAEPGLSHVRRALEKGLHVSTPNKGPIVVAYRELTALARQRDVKLRFDGTVAGGLPAIALGARDLRGATIERLDAVPNLTTGFVLDRLAAGATWDNAIEQARAGGALEGDGSWDLDGWDATAKLAILAMTVLDLEVDVRAVPRQGIRDVDLAWLRAQSEVGLVRLLATAQRRSNGEYDLRVAPASLPFDHPLGRLGPKQMGIAFETDLFGSITSVIEEETPLPSAATMLRDLLDIYARE